VPKDITCQTAMTMGLALAPGLQEVAVEVTTSSVNGDASSSMKTGSRSKPKGAIAP